MKKTKTITGIIGKLWRWSWLITLPATIFFLLWTVHTFQMYYTFKLKYLPQAAISLLNIGKQQSFYLTSDIVDPFKSAKRSADQGLQAIHVFINESELNKLNSNLPYSGRNYVTAKLLYPDGKIYKVKVKYRGDFSYHWTGRKKSIRVKTKKNNLYMGMRAFNLIIPKATYTYNNFLSYRLGKELGLLSPESDLVEVYINGKYVGVQLMVEQLSEQFLRRNERMPGDIYVGETIGRDKFPSVENEIFYNSNYWTKSAFNNHNPEDWSVPIEKLSGFVYKRDPERIFEVIDLEKWAKFTAFITLSRSAHYDTAHNWRLYFDPARGKLEPIVWDPFGWFFRVFVKLINRTSNRDDIISNTIFETLHNDHRFLAAKHEAIEHFFKSGGDVRLLESMDNMPDVEASIKADRNLHYESVEIYHPKYVIDEIHTFKEKVSQTLSTIKKTYTDTPPVASYSIDNKAKMIQLNVLGFTAVKFIDLKFTETAAHAGRVSISFKNGDTTTTKDITHLASSDGNSLRLNTVLFAARKAIHPEKVIPLILRDVKIEPLSYFIKLGGVDISALKALYVGYSDGKTIKLDRKEALELFSSEGNTNIVPLEKIHGKTIWSGEKLIEGVVEIEDDLIIKPGTRVFFAPRSSLVVTGRLHAVGSVAEPVSFIPHANNKDPWGAVVIAGKGANGSKISNALFDGGSGLRHKMVEYSAMLSIHDVKDIVIERTTFMNSKLVDDMVHAVYSEVTIRDSIFKNALSDALDLDYVKGSVENTYFINSGNDALDLMSSLVTVSESTMIGSGDKGISIGEDTETLIVDSSIEECAIGVQAKDHSRAYIYNVDLVGNKISIDAYKKNWQYGDGGRIKLYKSRIIGISPTVTSDKDSMVEIFDSYLDGKTGKKKKRIRIDKSVDDDDAYKHKARSKDPYLKESEIDEFLRPLFRTTDPSVRGVIENET